MVTTIVMMLVLGVIPGPGPEVVDRFLNIEVDECIEKVNSMLLDYNCGSCGYVGRDGLAKALVEGEVAVVGTYKPYRPSQKVAIVEYLNTTLGSDGACVKVKV